MSWLTSADRRLFAGCWRSLTRCSTPQANQPPRSTSPAAGPTNATMSMVVKPSALTPSTGRFAQQAERRARAEGGGRLASTERRGSFELPANRWRLSRTSRVTIILGLVLNLFVATGFGPVGYVESREARYPVLTGQVAQIQRLTPPSIGAYAAIVMEGETGGVVYERHAYERLPMASMTKMMTALLAIERGQLDQVVTVQVNAADYPDSSLMGLVPGERLTLEELLYGLMLPSGNDAAIAIARVIGGGEATFVNLMNRRAAELGLADTNFVNPHGLDDPAHYSSAYDMARLARYAMRNPDFARIVGTQEHVVQGSTTHQLRNTNQLLFMRPDVRGVKTGYTEAAGRCVTAVAVQDNHQIFVVVMQSADYVADATTLIDHAYDNYTWLPLNPPPSPLYGAPDQRPSAPETVFLPDWKAAMLRAELQDDGVPTLVFSVGETIFGRLKLNLN